VELVALSEDDHRKWEGWVESRLRFLILNLEQTPNLKYAIPFPQSYQHNALDLTGSTIYQSSFFMGLTLNLPKTPAGAPPATVDLTPAVTDFVQAVKEWPQRTSTMDITVRYLRRAELPSFVFGEGERPVPQKRKKRDRPVDQTDLKKRKLDPAASLATPTIAQVQGEQEIGSETATPAGN